ncbi:hypothetical protein A3K55_02345 [Candidatus Shapirobacteria bacterium RBG_13_44_7]|uniref:Uncharacterized protein n=1 Tax=Candidatus Shapirobacteria bacterium RBG_13_44_7 TaxID=1802149 RepID=A0A1F7SF12_9BACT|nr:MAG: hypothetical protein A3K55_02345 [Candidatus Shapirobacteria bacterium RBG_13_44_7]
MSRRLRREDYFRVRPRPGELGAGPGEERFLRVWDRVGGVVRRTGEVGRELAEEVGWLVRVARMVFGEVRRRGQERKVDRDGRA